MTRRVALSGLESSHADGLVSFLNVDRRRADARVSVLIAGDGQEARVAELSRTGGIDAVVHDAAEAAAQADVLVVCERDGRRHRRMATEFSARGLPVLVDKPFACTVDDATAMVAAAREGQALLTSFSPLRYAPATRALHDRLGELATAPGVTVQVSGPADVHSEYGGIHFYGSHLADLVAALLPGPFSGIRVQREAHAWVATARAGQHRAMLRFDDPDHAHGFEVRVPERAEEVRIVTDASYLHPSFGVFFDAVVAGSPPIEPADLLRPVELLVEIERQIVALS